MVSVQKAKTESQLKHSSKPDFIRITRNRTRQHNLSKMHSKSKNKITTQAMVKARLYNKNNKEQKNTILKKIHCYTCQKANIEKKNKTKKIQPKQI